MIEYGPPEAAGLSIMGENVVVMNCIWVQRRAQGRGFGEMLINTMKKSENHAAGFATIALEGYWMMWMQKWMMEKLGFQSINSMNLKHKNHKKGHCFTAHLMWLPEIHDVHETKVTVEDVLSRDFAVLMPGKLRVNQLKCLLIRKKRSSCLYLKQMQQCKHLQKFMSPLSSILVGLT